MGAFGWLKCGSAGPCKEDGEALRLTFRNVKTLSPQHSRMLCRLMLTTKQETQLKRNGEILGENARPPCTPSYSKHPVLSLQATPSTPSSAPRPHECL